MQVLRKEMKLKGLTIQDLSNRLGVSAGSVSGWIHGNNSPTSKFVKALKDMGFSDMACLDPSRDVEV